VGERVLDPGPIPYSEIALHGDPDLEHELEGYGADPAATSYRLIEIPTASISDTDSMPRRAWNRSIAEAIRSGVELPPVVVFRHRETSRWGLLDGVNRTNAYVGLGVALVRAYELLEP
jgi:hypothetical protein